MFYELNLIAFVGSANNQKFHNKKLVLWDNDKKKAVQMTQFKSPIVNIKVIKRVIFIATKEEINICIFNENFNVVEIISKVNIDFSSSFDIWISNNSTYFLASVFNKSYIKITATYDNCSKSEELKTIDTEFYDFPIQNIFYNDKINMLFVVDGNGSYIKGYNSNDFSQVCNFYRGQSFAFVSSICVIKNNYLAVSSSNRTIHIFEISYNNGNSNNNISNSNSYSYFGKLFNFFKNPFSLNKSIVKIRLNEITEKEEEMSIFDSDFKSKGLILLYDDENDHLICLGYNGIIYYVKFDADNKSYKIINKYNWCISDELKNSIYVSEDFALNLIGMQSKINIENESDNWKII
jgi:hypothetical protein